MGVMACSRNGCENIMCDLYSSEHGYICYDCYNELRDGSERNVKAFMQSPKSEYAYSDRDSWHNYLDGLFY